MKAIYYLFFLFLTIGCSRTTIPKKEKTKELKNIYSYVEQKVDSFHHELEQKIIEPDYIVVTQNDTITIENTLIKPFQTNEGLNIKVNDYLIQTFKYTTLNDAENGEIEVSFASNLKKIKYYKQNQLIIFELNFSPCTGLGCLIDFHLIYDLNNNNVYPFAMFRSYNSELYRLSDIEKPIYLAKSYEGNLHEGNFTYEYSFFKIEKKEGNFLMKDDKKINILIDYEDYKPTKIKLNNFHF